MDSVLLFVARIVNDLRWFLFILNSELIFFFFGVFFFFCFVSFRFSCDFDLCCVVCVWATNLHDFIYSRSMSNAGKWAASLQDEETSHQPEFYFGIFVFRFLDFFCFFFVYVWCAILWDYTIFIWRRIETCTTGNNEEKNKKKKLTKNSN